MTAITNKTSLNNNTKSANTSTDIFEQIINNMSGIVNTTKNNTIIHVNIIKVTNI